MLKFNAILGSVVAVFLIAVGVQAQTVIDLELGDSFQETLQEALILAEPGTTIVMPAGRFEFTGGLSLDVSDITLRGAGMDETILSFKGQLSGSEGFLVTSDRVRLEGFAVEDTPGDGIKAKGVDQISLVDLKVEWTRGPHSENGAYGLYPVQSTNVLIEGAVVNGASDAGIYVGQSQHIIVRNSRAEYNVAGIEIENSYYADVYDNIATHNTGGILIFDLPNLPQMGGHSVRVFNNKSYNNDTANFAPEGNIVATVPKGTGLLVMANRNVEIFGNELGDNASVNLLLAAYPREYNDPEYNPLPRGIYIHGNTYGRAGWEPDKQVKELIAPATGVPVPDIVWDGAVDGIWAAFFGPDEGQAIIIDETEDVTFANLQFVKDMILPWGASATFNIKDHAGSRPAIAAVTLAQEAAPAAN
jgi:parallel beta-helix repeat protein